MDSASEIKATEPPKKRNFVLFAEKPTGPAYDAIDEMTYVFIKPEGGEWQFLIKKDSTLQARKFSDYEGLQALLPQDVRSLQEEKADAIERCIKITNSKSFVLKAIDEFIQTEISMHGSMKKLAEEFKAKIPVKDQAVMRRYLEPFLALQENPFPIELELKSEGAPFEKLAVFEKTIRAVMEGELFKQNLRNAYFVFVDDGILDRTIQQYFKDVPLDKQFNCNFFTSPAFQRPSRYQILFDTMLEHIEKLRKLGVLTQQDGQVIAHFREEIAQKNKQMNDYMHSSKSILALGMIAHALHEMQAHLAATPQLDKLQQACMTKFMHDMLALIASANRSRVGIENIPKYFRNTVLIMYADCYVLSKYEKNEVLLNAMKAFIKAVDTQFEETLHFNEADTVMGGKQVFKRRDADIDIFAFASEQKTTENVGLKRRGSIGAIEQKAEAIKRRGSTSATPAGNVSIQEALTRHLLDGAIYNMIVGTKDMERIFKNTIETIRKMGPDAVNHWNQLAIAEFDEFRIPEGNDKLEHFYQSSTKWRQLPNTESARNAELIKRIEDCYAESFKGVNQSPEMLKRYSLTIRQLRAVVGTREELRQAIRYQLFALYVDAYLEGRGAALFSKYSDSLLAIDRFITLLEKSMLAKGQNLLIADALSSLDEKKQNVKFILGRVRSVLSNDDCLRLVEHVFHRVTDALKNVGAKGKEAEVIFVNAMKLLQRMGSVAKLRWNSLVLTNELQASGLLIDKDKLGDKPDEKLREKNAEKMFEDAKKQFKSQALNREEKLPKSPQTHRPTSSVVDQEIKDPVFLAEPPSIVYLEVKADQADTDASLMRYTFIGRIQEAQRVLGTRVYEVSLEERVPLEYFERALTAKLQSFSFETKKIEEMVREIERFIAEHLGLALLHRPLVGKDQKIALQLLEEFVRDVDVNLLSLPVPAFFARSASAPLMDERVLGHLADDPTLSYNALGKPIRSSESKENSAIRDSLAAQANAVVKEIKDHPSFTLEEIQKLRNSLELLVKTHAVSGDAERMTLRKALLQIYTNAYLHAREKSGGTTTKPKYLTALEETLLYIEMLLAKTGHQQGWLVQKPADFDAKGKNNREDVVFARVIFFLKEDELKDYVKQLYDSAKRELTSLGKQEEKAINIGVNAYKILQKVGEEAKSVQAKAVWKDLTDKETQPAFKKYFAYEEGSDIHKKIRENDARDLMRRRFTLFDLPPDVQTGRHSPSTKTTPDTPRTPVSERKESPDDSASKSPRHSKGSKSKE